MQAFITLIPTRRNDGSVVSRTERDAILQGLWERFGGVTREGLVEGHWIDPGDGEHYRDRCWKVVVAFSAERLEEAKNAVLEIGRQLGQKSMYFEVRENIDVLNVPKT